MKFEFETLQLFYNSVLIDSVCHYHEAGILNIITEKKALQQELTAAPQSSCVGSAVLVFLRKMQRTISAFEISTKGFRNENHPGGFKSIYMDIHLKSPDVSESDLKML